MFLIYIKDLPLENRLGKIHLFADDATITAHKKNIEIVKSQLTVETQNTYNWCRDNGMVVSAEKTKAMLIISKSKESRLETIDRDFYLNVNDTTIKNTKHEKLLGVIIDNNLSWQHQVNKVRKTVLFKLSILRKIRKYLSSPLRILYYNYYIKPHLEYCWHTFDKIVNRRQALMVFRALNNQAPTYVIDMFKPPCTNTHGLRSKTNNKLYVPKAHRKSFRYNGPKVWNVFNDNTRKAKSISQFKS